VALRAQVPALVPRGLPRDQIVAAGYEVLEDPANDVAGPLVLAAGVAAGAEGVGSYVAGKLSETAPQLRQMGHDVVTLALDGGEHERAAEDHVGAVVLDALHLGALGGGARGELLDQLTEYARWIEEGKKPETRADRVAKTIKRLTEPR
jgi:hypothetical protein